MPYELLNKARLTAALRRLGELAQARGLVLELSLYGGAVFTLVYGSRESTRDVDGLIRPTAAAEPLIAQVAREQNLPPDWLNSDVQQFLAPKEEKRVWTDADLGLGLRITLPTAAYLLALKLRACRSPLPGFAGDEEDIRFLLRRLRPKSYDQVAAGFERFFPGETPDERAEALVRRVLKEVPR
ncbi:MAG: hypothetical protein RLZZ221_1773 [Verrucomicrobiota bacterium]|jgi:hypothetical protein